MNKHNLLLTRLAENEYGGWVKAAGRPMYHLISQGGWL